MKWILINIINIYQLIISPLIAPRCRFYPSCSQYSKEAIVNYGVLRGLLLSFARLFRCNPLFPGGYDPLPNKRDA